MPDPRHPWVPGTRFCSSFCSLPLVQDNFTLDPRVSRLSSSPPTSQPGSPHPATAGRQQPQISPDPPLAAHTKVLLLVDSLREAISESQILGMPLSHPRCTEGLSFAKMFICSISKPSWLTPLDQSPKPACLPNRDTSSLIHPLMPSCFHLPLIPHGSLRLTQRGHLLGRSGWPKPREARAQHLERWRPLSAPGKAKGKPALGSQVSAPGHQAQRAPYWWPWPLQCGRLSPWGLLWAGGLLQPQPRPCPLPWPGGSMPALPGLLTRVSKCPRERRKGGMRE